MEKTGDNSYNYDTFIDTYGVQIGQSIIYKSLLEACYDTKNGMYFFVRFIIGDLLDIGFPKPYRYNSLIRKWDNLVKSNKKLGILSARGHGKTLFFSDVLNIYDMFLFKHRRIIFVSASQEQANRILAEMKTIIDNNEWLITKKNNNRWAVETIGYNGGYVIAKGIGSEILGEHVDRIVLDDILQTLDTSKKISDQQIEDYIDMTLDPMLLNRNGQMLVIGTPKSESDIFSTITTRAENDGVWKLASFPAILDYENKILQCPDRFTWKMIMEKRLSMGSLKFAREYQLEFFSRDTSLFPKHIIDPAKTRGKDMRLLNKADGRGGHWVYVMGVDIARSGSVSADFSVCIILAFNTVTQDKQLVHLWRKKGLKISQQCKELAEIAKNFNYPYMIVEQNNMGRDMIDQLVDDYNLFVEGFVTGGKGQKKDELIRFLINSFEHEQLIFPQNDKNSVEIIKGLEDELSKFCVSYTNAGNEQFKGMGSHDDQVMALALANRATQTVGVPFAISSFSNDSTTRPQNNDPYKAFYSNNTKESDLVTKINLGLIK